MLSWLRKSREEEQVSSSLDLFMSAADMQDLQAKLIAYFADPSIDELLINGTYGMSLVGGGKVRFLPSIFRSDDEFVDWLLTFAAELQVRLDPLCGSAGGMLSGGGFRWHCVLPPLAADGPLFTLRRHRFQTLNLADFKGSVQAKAALMDAYICERPILIAGPTGSGKTSLLVALLREQAIHDRVLILESLPELPLLSSSWLRLVERPPSIENVGSFPIGRLVAEAMRLKPDRLVIGEIRREEATAFVQCLMSGHGGVLSTIHAGSAEQALARLVSLCEHAERPEREWLLEGGLTVALMKRGALPYLDGVVTLQRNP